jgi:hypothetical protein
MVRHITSERRTAMPKNFFFKLVSIISKDIERGTSILKKKDQAYKMTHEATISLVKAAAYCKASKTVLFLFRMNLC